MSDRKPIPKKLRFEVFKRDKFTCQYCGKSAPDVVLEIDHIVPVSKGGDNDIMNLVTSCSDCNRGKSNIELSDDAVIKARKKQLDEIAERREQLEMMYEWQQVLIADTAAKVQKVCDLIGSMTCFTPSERGEKVIKNLINKFGYDVVLDATRIAFEQYRSLTSDECEYAFNKIGGICFNKTHKTCTQCLNCVKKNRKVDKPLIACSLFGSYKGSVDPRTAQTCDYYESRYS